jgi:hypothetical protein
LRVFAEDHEIINIYRYVLIVVSLISHPDVGFHFALDETDLSKNIGESFVPACTARFEAIEGFDDEESMPFSFTKFGTSYDVHLFGS